MHLSKLMVPAEQPVCLYYRPPFYLMSAGRSEVRNQIILHTERLDSSCEGSERRKKALVVWLVAVENRQWNERSVTPFRSTPSELRYAQFAARKTLLGWGTFGLEVPRCYRCVLDDARMISTLMSIYRRQMVRLDSRISQSPLACAQRRGPHWCPIWRWLR